LFAPLLASSPEVHVPGSTCASPTSDYPTKRPHAKAPPRQSIGADPFGPSSGATRWTLFATQLVAAVLLTVCGSGGALAEEMMPMVRLSKLVIDASQIESYRAFLTEEVNDSMRLEPGVRTLYAVSEKERPTHFTILEIYADSAAYEAHIKSAHFLKYKTGTKSMVTSLELIDTVPLVPDLKIK
jgi:quinol monooxygenase YgiN